MNNEYIKLIVSPDMPALQLQQNQTPQMQTLSCHQCFWTLVCWYRLCFHMARTVFSATGDLQFWVNIPRKWQIWNIDEFCGIVITHIWFTWYSFSLWNLCINLFGFFLGVGVNLFFCAINTWIYVLLTTYTVFSSKSFNSWIGVFLLTLVLSSLSLKIETKNNLTKYIIFLLIQHAFHNQMILKYTYKSYIDHVHIYLKEIWMWKSLSYLDYILCKAWYFLECQECLDVNICKKSFK